MEKLSHEMEWKEKDQQINANLYITEGAERKKILDRMFKIIIQENCLEIREKLNLHIKGLILCLEKLQQNNQFLYIYIYILIKLLDIEGREKEILRNSRQKYQVNFNDDELS